MGGACPQRKSGLLLPVVRPAALPAELRKVQYNVVELVPVRSRAVVARPPVILWVVARRETWTKQVFFWVLEALQLVCNAR